MQSRVPLILVRLDEVPLKSWYNSVVGMHIDNVSIESTPTEAVAAVQNKNLPIQFAVLVLDLDESKSPAVVQELEKLGYINAYYIQGGWQGLITERQNTKQ